MFATTSYPPQSRSPVQHRTTAAIGLLGERDIATKAGLRLGVGLRRCKARPGSYGSEFSGSRPRDVACCSTASTWHRGTSRAGSRRRAENCVGPTLASPGVCRARLVPSRRRDGSRDRRRAARHRRARAGHRLARRARGTSSTWRSARSPCCAAATGTSWSSASPTTQPGPRATASREPDLHSSRCSSPATNRPARPPAAPRPPPRARCSCSRTT